MTDNELNNRFGAIGSGFEAIGEAIATILEKLDRIEAAVGSSKPTKVADAAQPVPLAMEAMPEWLVCNARNCRVMFYEPDAKTIAGTRRAAEKQGWRTGVVYNLGPGSVLLDFCPKHKDIP